MPGMEEPSPPFALGRRELLALAGGAGLLVVAWRLLGEDVSSVAIAATPSPLHLSDVEWRRRLSPQAYQVLRHGATEAPFSSPLDKNYRKGLYACAGCGRPLYSSATKFDSGTGWPSFWAPLPHAMASGGTARSAWSASKSTAPAAPATSVTSSRMAPGPPACATA